MLFRKNIRLDLVDICFFIGKFVCKTLDNWFSVITLKLGNIWLFSPFSDQVLNHESIVVIEIQKSSFLRDLVHKLCIHIHKAQFIQGFLSIFLEIQERASD